MVISQKLQSRISWLLICLVLIPLGMVVIDSIVMEVGNMELWTWMITHSFTALIAYLLGGGKISKLQEPEKD